ncbi:MAG TPA: hypothetical protein VNY05_06320 [Candidatus Acidoferrales bacterium]|jgi:hypothetical protein|nr:hypothetical protein [Candidatus Acidoferrales bacterium]
MSAETGLPLPDPGSLTRGRFTYFPVVPGRLEFAIEVRQAILGSRPRVIALELPAGLQPAWLRAVARLPQISLIFYPDESGGENEAVYVPIEPADPFTEAIRTGLETGAEIVFVDPDASQRPHLKDAYPDTYAIRHIGLDRYIEAYRVYPQARSAELSQHAAGIAWKLQGTDPAASVMVVLSLNLLDPVLDAMEEPQAQPMAKSKRDDIELLNAHPESLGEIAQEYPALQWRYENFRRQLTDAKLPDVKPTDAKLTDAKLTDANLIDRRHAQLGVFRDAEKEYEASTGERIAHWQRRLLARYTRNLALAGNDLAAGIFDLTVAARSIADDNYAWDVWETASRYPPQRTESDLMTVRISGDEVWMNTRRIRLRRRLPSTKRRLRPYGLKPRKKEKVPGEWASQLNGTSICSYPPEDLVIEDYGRFLKHKGKSVLSEERVRVEPFTTSILDGIDLRETIRKWYEGRIYVRQFQKIQGEVGSVVVIFDEDRDNRYSYMTTWLGENQNESDMAFYSTFPFENLVGPGIGRAEYGGFLMSLPARRMYDVWQDADYEAAESKPERLLLAALDYSVHRYVVYVAARPPRTIFKTIASRAGRTVIYIPIGQLSPVSLKKIRVVHVLDGYDKREIAKDYLW